MDDEEDAAFVRIAGSAAERAKWALQVLSHRSRRLDAHVFGSFKKKTNNERQQDSVCLFNACAATLFSALLILCA